MAPNIFYPFQIDGSGRTRQANEEAWIRGLIEQVLFTSPGERVMRPDFGSGVRQLVFAPNSPELAATTQSLVHGALQQWLGALIVVDAVEIEAVDSTLTITVNYMIRRTESHQTETFVQGGGS
jgi:phage baseplate assembly protein W